MIISDFLRSSHPDRPFVAVLGHPVGHSLSPGIHNLALRHHQLDITYYAVDCPPEERHYIPRLLKRDQFRGANITIPLKEQISQYLDEVENSALEIGAVNTVVPVSGPEERNSRKLKGYNTDVYGFLKPLEDVTGIETATILGSGGASRAVRYALSRSGVHTLFLISRTLKPEKSTVKQGSRNNPVQHVLGYDEIEKAVKVSDLIVNTTPVGMYPDSDRSPLPESVLDLLNGKLCYDIVYNPLNTMMLKQAKEHGARIIGGLEMFVYQASAAFDLWFSRPMPVEEVRKLVMENIHSVNLPE